MGDLDSIRNIQISEIEPLYWIVEDSLFENKKAKAESVFSLLATIAQRRKELIVQALKPAYCKRLQEISYELYGTESFQSQKNIEIKMSTFAKQLPFTKEIELEEFLANHINILEQSLSESLKLTGRQIETIFGYKCDLVVESKNTYYPIELKINQTDHAVVSQIQKYCFYFYRQLRYDRYKLVQGIVIANGFCQWSINELRKNSIRIFDITSCKKQVIKLTEVK